MRIYDPAQTRWRTATETQNLCTNMHTHTYTHVYTCMCIPIRTHMQKYTYMHVHTHTYIHTYIHTYTHTHTTCTYAHTQERLERQRCSDCARSWYGHWKLSMSLSFNTINHIMLAPPMPGLHCTHFLRPQHLSTPHPLFPKYPKTVRGPWLAQFYFSTLTQKQIAPLWRSSLQLRNGPLCSCRKIGGKAEVQQSPSR